MFETSRHPRGSMAVACWFFRNTMQTDLTKMRLKDALHSTLTDLGNRWKGELGPGSGRGGSYLQ